MLRLGPFRVGPGRTGRRISGRYDLDGRVATVTTGPDSTAFGSGSWMFGYDSLNRLSTAALPPGRRVWLCLRRQRQPQAGNARRRGHQLHVLRCDQSSAGDDRRARPILHLRRGRQYRDQWRPCVHLRWPRSIVAGEQRLQLRDQRSRSAGEQERAGGNRVLRVRRAGAPHRRVRRVRRRTAGDRLPRGYAGRERAYFGVRRRRHLSDLQRSPQHAAAHHRRGQSNGVGVADSTRSARARRTRTRAGSGRSRSTCGSPASTTTPRPGCITTTSAITIRGSGGMWRVIRLDCAADLPPTPMSMPIR